MTVNCDCFICGEKIEITVSGHHRPATWAGPAEYPDLEVDAPCKHECLLMTSYRRELWEEVRLAVEEMKAMEAEARWERKREEALDERGDRASSVLDD